MEYPSHATGLGTGAQAAWLQRLGVTKQHTAALPSGETDRSFSEGKKPPFPRPWQPREPPRTRQTEFSLRPSSGPQLQFGRSLHAPWGDSPEGKKSSIRQEIAVSVKLVKRFFLLY